jgi:AraC-like DNA-binding protein
MGDTSALIDTHGAQQGIQLNLTPLGAYRLLGLPMSELANQAVALEDVLGGPAVALVDRLGAAPTWGDRYAVLDETLLGWLADGPDPDPAVAWAWNQLDAAAGGVAIGDLADETGWSRRHFIQRFRDQVGLAPKATARVLRFNEAMRLLRERRPGTSITDVAMACGYTDHSHLTREFKRLAGCTPSAWLATISTEAFGTTA